MKRFIPIAIAALLTVATSCTDSKKNNTAEPTVVPALSPDTAKPTPPDSIASDPYGMLAWQVAVEGKPLSKAQLDSVVDYFAQAAKWSETHLANVKTQEQFDKTETEYLIKFKYLNIYSDVLEAHAQTLDSDQMAQLEKVYNQLGEALGAAAQRAGIAPQQ